jgi:hypothetical protein
MEISNCIENKSSAAATHCTMAQQYLSFFELSDGLGHRMRFVVVGIDLGKPLGP